MLKNSYLCLLNNTNAWNLNLNNGLWFAEKFVSLLIEQHLSFVKQHTLFRCDLLKNSYLCLLNNTRKIIRHRRIQVVICWKIRIFAYWTTPTWACGQLENGLWFAEKFVSLLIEQHPQPCVSLELFRCDLLKNSYLCLLNNTIILKKIIIKIVVICWKIRIFAYWTTPIHWRHTNRL